MAVARPLSFDEFVAPKRNGWKATLGIEPRSVDYETTALTVELCRHSMRDVRRAPERHLCCNSSSIDIHLCYAADVRSRQPIRRIATLQCNNVRRRRSDGKPAQ